VLLAFQVLGSMSQVDTVYQNIPLNQAFDENTMVLKFQLVTPEGKMIVNYPVRMYCAELNKVFIAKSDDKAIARFYVPTRYEYQIGVGSIDNYQTLKVMYEEPPVLTKILKFAVSDVNETTQNDTVFQIVKSSDKASSERALVIISVEDFNNNPLADEAVYMNSMDNGLVYTASTNQEGKAYFLLPKTNTYLLHLTYERNIREINFPDFASLHTTTIHLSYVGTNNVNNWFSDSNRTREGFLQKFMESPITPLLEPEKDFFTVTPNGFQLFKSAESSTSSPAVAFGNIYTGAGLYSTSYYCLDATTGAFKWGVTLADNGPSASVQTDSVLLINTESCTLYAINAINGKLLWSKWLAPYLFSTPSVVNKRVITVYPAMVSHQMQDFQLANKIIVAFDLKTGDIAWQNWLDGEILGSAVGADSSVYLTTHTGRLYKYSVNTGELKAMSSLDAVSQPTVIGDKLVVSVRTKNNPAKYELALVSTDKLEILKRFSHVSGETGFNHPSDLSYADLLNFNGSQALHYNNVLYTIVQGNLIALDAESGEVKWRVSVGENKTMPVMAGGYILVSAQSGVIKVVDPKSGKVAQTYRTGLPLFSQLMVWKGWIFSGTSKGGVTAFRTNDKKLDGWYMWGKDASHNTSIP